MSETAKSAHEIEDVLSSIRRLVSEAHAGPGRSPMGRAAPVSGDAPDHAGKLVLTPALRVTEPDDPWVPVPSAEGEEEATPETAAATPFSEVSAFEDEEEDADPSWGLEDRLSDWGEIEESAAESVADAEADSDAGPHGHEDAMGTASEEVSTVDAGHADLSVLSPPVVAGEFEPETGDADWPGAGADKALRALALAREHLKAASARETASKVSDHANTPAAPEDAPEAGLDVADSQTAQADASVQSRNEDADADAGPIETDGDHEAPEPGHAAPETGEAEVEATAAPASEASPPQPDASVTGLPVFSRRLRRPFIDRPEPEPTDGEPARAAPADDTGTAQDAGTGWTDATDPDDGEDADGLLAADDFEFDTVEDGLLDEERLREIIAEVVRQELQGVLGQRITRNVRKLVRREIRLALAVDDLD